MISIKFYQIVPQSSIYYVRNLTSKSPKKENKKQKQKQNHLVYLWLKTRIKSLTQSSIYYTFNLTSKVHIYIYICGWKKELSH